MAVIFFPTKKQDKSKRVNLPLGFAVELHKGGASGKENHPDGSPQKVHGTKGGQKAWVKANGKNKDVTQSPEFKKWFGKSKVVDADGKPLVVYKGMYPYDTNTGEEIKSINRRSEFPAFNGAEKGIKIAGFFGDKDVAGKFATGATTEGAVYPVYLSIKNPYVVDAGGVTRSGDIQFGKSGKPFRDAMRSGEYDGAIFINTPDEGNVYVTLFPEQSKSIYNAGDFDPTNPNILLSE